MEDQKNKECAIIELLGVQLEIGSGNEESEAIQIRIRREKRERDEIEYILYEIRESIECRGIIISTEPK